MVVGNAAQVVVSSGRLAGPCRPEVVNRGHFRLGSFAEHIDPERTVSSLFWRARLRSSFTQLALRFCDLICLEHQ
jgi:hypothetical protein